MQAKNLVQTTAPPVFAASVSVSPYEPCLVDSVGHVLLVAPITSDSYNLSSPFFAIPLVEDRWRDLCLSFYYGVLQFGLSKQCLAVSLCTGPISHLLLEEASLMKTGQSTGL